MKSHGLVFSFHFSHCPFQGVLKYDKSLSNDSKISARGFLTKMTNISGLVQGMAKLWFSWYLAAESLAAFNAIELVAFPIITIGTEISI